MLPDEGQTVEIEAAPGMRCSTPDRQDVAPTTARVQWCGASWFWAMDDNGVSHYRNRTDTDWRIK